MEAIFQSGSPDGPVGSSHPLLLLVFSVAGQRYALRLASVERVIQAVELRALPRSPPVIRGVLNLQGRILPVGDLRRRFELPDRDVALDDWIIIARTPTRVIGLLAEGGASIEECSEDDIVSAATIPGGAKVSDGIARLPSGLVLIQNLDRFLSIEEERTLTGALDAHR